MTGRVPGCSCNLNEPERRYVNLLIHTEFDVIYVAFTVTTEPQRIHKRLDIYVHKILR